MKRFWLTLGVAAALAAAGSAATATVREAAWQDGTALEVDGWRLSGRALQVLRRVVQQRDPKAGAAEVVEGVVRDHVIGENAAQVPGDAVLFDSARVAFAPEVSAEAALIATLEHVFADRLRALQPADSGHFIVKRHAVTSAQLTALLNATASLRLDDRLTLAQRAALRSTPLVDYRFAPGAALQTVTLADVWQRIEVHGRQALRNGDAAFAQRQADALVHRAFVRYAVQGAGLLDPADLEALQQLMLDHERRLAWTRWQGGGTDLHEPAAGAVAQQAAVTREEIARYYAEHPEAFQRIDRVLARHIRCADERCAQAARSALLQGEPFAQVARRFSSASGAAAGGELGWIDAAQARSDWLLQFAFAQPPGPASVPVRVPAPEGAPAAWEIVQVDERVMGVHEAGSETVRFIATQAIARRKAMALYEQTSAQWLQDAQVAVDPAVAGASASALQQKGL